MITMSKAVLEDLESHFSEHERQDIRIYLAPAENTMRLNIMLDHAQDNDEVIEAYGYRFCLKQGLLEKCGGINIDLNDLGFIVEPVIPFAKNQSSCGSACGSTGGTSVCSPSTCSTCSSACPK